MSSSPIPNSPTRSRRLEARAVPHRSRLRRPWRLLAWGLIGGLAGGGAAAHTDARQAMTQSEGGHWSAAVALTTLDATADLPSRVLPAVLLQGGSGMDRRGGQLEHGVVEASWRGSAQWAVALALGRHGSEPAHTESAWVRYTPHGFGGPWQIDAGRQRPDLGAVITPAGHFDRFTLMPLAKQAALGGDWVDDGVQAAYQHDSARARVRLQAGLWRASVFPGAPQGSLAVTAQPGVQWHDPSGAWAADAFWAHFEPRARGALIATTGGGHVHGALDCGAGLSQRVCFDGRSEVLGASVRWQSALQPLRLEAAGLLRHEPGQLESMNGQARYRGRQGGVWAEVGWAWRQGLETAWRVEGVQASQWLQGSGASVLAREAGFAAYQPVRRLTWVLAHRPVPEMSVSFEAGRETAGPRAANFLAVRLVYRLSGAFGGGE